MPPWYVISLSQRGTHRTEPARRASDGSTAGDRAHSGGQPAIRCQDRAGQAIVLRSAVVGKRHRLVQFLPQRHGQQYRQHPHVLRRVRRTRRTQFAHGVERSFLQHAILGWARRTLEDQAKGPILNPIEMAMPDESSAVDRIRSIPGYVSQFETVFGGEVPVNYDNIAKAIASYERTLVTPDSPFDRFINGDKEALNSSAQRGMQTVQDIGCTACHSGPIFAGPGTLPIGQGFFQRFPLLNDSEYVAKYRLAEDLGRYTVTEKESDKHMWRVPTWRNVALTAPYFHNGSVDTLDEAVRVMAKTQLGLDLSAEQVGDIVAFLESLTGEFHGRPCRNCRRLPATGSWRETRTEHLNHTI